MPDLMQDSMDYYGYYTYSYFGLFWQDLSDFFSDCAVADDCSDDYETDYSEGAAVGNAWYIGNSDYEDWYDMMLYYGSYTPSVAFCLYATAGCTNFYVYYEGVSYYQYYAELRAAYYDTSDYYIDDVYPYYVSYLTYAPYTRDGDYGYGFSDYMFMNAYWDYSSDDLPDGEMVFWRFQNTSGDYYYAVGDEATVWALASTDATANVDTDVTMAGAASLAAATTAVAAVLATM